MAIVELHPDAQKRTYLRAGQYGPNMQYNAECEIIEYQFPADEPPRYAPDTDAEDWCHMQIQVNSDDFGGTRLYHHEPIGAFSGSKLGNWLNGIGVPCEGETFRHDDEQVVGRKIAIEVGDPREDKNEKGKWYTGKIIQLIGL
jgi:hypothetical protein